MSLSMNMQSSYQFRDESTLWERRLSSTGQGCAGTTTATVRVVNSNIDDASTSAYVIIAVLCLAVIGMCVRKHILARAQRSLQDV
tara:strand:+ start:280 stop:534 length:255 start_codon:yes stop_codon:yes gene_type:complete